MSALWVVLVVLAVLGWWMNDVRRHPWKTCPSCGGKGRIPGILPGTHADCGKCGTKGRVRRWGAGGGK